MKYLKNKFIIYSAIIAFFGFIDATYLTILHFKNATPPCTISGCEVVLTSKYATILGIPLALLGSFFYISVIVVCLLILTDGKKMWLQIFYLLAGTGFMISAVLFGIQAIELKAFCQYCLLSAATSTGVAILAFLHYRQESSLTKES